MVSNVIRFVARIGVAALNALVWPFIELGSNPVLFAGIVLITIVWVLQSAYSPHPWDNYKAGLPKLVMWYTLWFGLVEGATKIAQALESKRNRAMQERLQREMEEMQLLNARIAAHVDEIHELNEKISQQNAAIITQTAHIQDLTSAIRGMLEEAEDRGSLLHDMVSKLLDAIEDPCEHDSVFVRTIVDLAKSVRSQLADETDTPFHALVSKLVDAILQHREAA